MMAKVEWLGEAIVDPKYKDFLIAWAQKPLSGAPSLTPQYGDWSGDKSGTWDCFRDGQVLSAFAKWWNAKKGADLSVGTVSSSGVCKNVLVAEFTPQHRDALDSFAVEEGITPTAQWPSSQPVFDFVPVNVPPASPVIDFVPQQVPEPTPETAPPPTCGPSEILVEGKCVPAPVLAPSSSKKSSAGWIIVGGLALAGAAAWAMGAFGGAGLAAFKDNPYPWTPSLPKNTTAKLRLYRVKIDSSGYDDRGRYWGVGQPLYFAEDDDGNHRALRAASREDAKRQFPNAKWYRG